MAGGREVDDGKPPVREAYATAIGNPRAFIIGPAMGEQIALAFEHPAIYRLVEPHESVDAAHRQPSAAIARMTSEKR
jgi:hypothetical protein